MSTNLQIITDALRGLGVIDETETPSAEQGSFCLRQLNQMLAGWSVSDGVDIGYSPQSSTAETCPIPEWAETGVYGQLALRVSSHFGVQQPPLGIVAAADNGYTAILRTVLNMKLDPADMSHLPLGTGRITYDITSR